MCCSEVLFGHGKNVNNTNRHAVRQDGGLTVRVSLESEDGNTSYASTDFEDVDGKWRHYKATLTVSPQVTCLSRHFMLKQHCLHVMLYLCQHV